MTGSFLWRGEELDLDDATRRAVSGRFVQLKHGFTHFETDGSTNARPVVLVHGFSVPYFIWDPTYHALKVSGFRPLRYDLYGRGYSDRPSVHYNLTLFIEQLESLLSALGIIELDLAGLSMGGIIAAAFAVRHPERVHSLILIDPAGARDLPLPLLYRMATLPGIGELVFGWMGTERMVKGAASDFFDPMHIDLFQDQYRIQMRFHGYKRAILSTIRQGMLGGFLEVYRQIGQYHLPVMLIWGQNDKTIPLEHSQVILDMIPHAEFHAIPACGHIPHFEKPEIVNSEIIKFLHSQ